MGLKLFFTQTEHEDQVWGSKGSDWAQQMQSQYQQNPQNPHVFVDDPHAADIIVMWEPHQDSQVIYAPRLRAHPLVQQFPNKVFIVSPEDVPLGFLSGLYCSLAKDLHQPHRHRTWIYYDTPNPLVANQPSTDLPYPELLASLRGADSHAVRSQLFQMQDQLNAQGIEVVETRRGRFSANPDDPALRDDQQRYIHSILNAKFSLCPRGHGPNSFRVQEVMALGRAPVIISDQWVPIQGPDWENFAIFLPEKDIPQLAFILQQYEPRWRAMGTAARRAYDAWFRPERFVSGAVDQIVELYQNRTHDEADYFARWDELIDWANAQEHLAYARR